VEVITLQVAKRLVGIGRFEQAAEYLEGVDAHKDAIDIYIRAGWLSCAFGACLYVCAKAFVLDKGRD
jgi:hypothetical protein